MAALTAQLDEKVVGSSCRTAPRRKLHLSVEGLTTSGTSDVLILDISTTGVLLRSDRELNSGETIQLNIPEGVGARAVVRWSDGQVFGCKFEEPISQAALSAALLRGPERPPVSRMESASPVRVSNDISREWVTGLCLLSWGLAIAAAAPLMWR